MDAESSNGIRVGLRLALAHHPLCQWFRADVIGSVCSGCAAALPGLALGLLAALFLLGTGLAAPLALGAAGLVLGLPQLSTYVYRGNRFHRAVAKVVGGLGFGLFATAALVVPVGALWKMGGAIAIGVAFLGLQVHRMRSILATCRRCPWAMDWDRCPGFNLAPPR